MKVTLLNTFFAPEGADFGRLEKVCDLTMYSNSRGLPDEEVIARIGDAQIVCTLEMSRSVMEKAPNLKAICTNSTGFNYIDLQAADELGITVCNNPTYGTYAVAQHAMALLLSLTNRIAWQDQMVREGKWNECSAAVKKAPSYELSGLTCGILGFGRIGQIFGQMAKGMGMKVIAYDAYPNERGRQIAEYVSLDELYARSDVISVHCPMTEETAHIINKDSIAKMKDGAILLNVSRGGLQVDADIAQALKSGKLGGCGLDVSDPEPVRADDPLLSASNCLITPHNAWCTAAAKQRMLDGVIDNIIAVIEGHPQCVVNRPGK